jgi:hypothetical protein
MLDSLCHFTATEKRQLTEFVTDLARIEKKNAESIFRRREFSGILEDRTLSRKDTGQKVLQLLRRLRYPHLVRAEKIWADGMEKLARPKDIWIPLAKAMESSRLEDALECSAARRAEGERWIAKNKLKLEHVRKQIHEIS